MFEGQEMLPVLVGGRVSRIVQTLIVTVLAVACGAACIVQDPRDASQTTQPVTCTNPYTRMKTALYPSKPRTWSPDVMVGAIRYDVWNVADEGGDLPNVLYKLLHQWFERAPFYTNLESAAFHAWADRREVMDQEIDYAAGRGIDYFAFLYSRFVTRDYVTRQYRSYDTLGNLQPHWNTSLSLDYYFKSTRCNKPLFALIVQSDTIKSYIKDWNVVVDQRAAWSIVIDDIVAQYQRPGVHKTPSGRPILFMLGADDASNWTSTWGTASDARAALDQLRTAFVAAGLGDPYLVILEPFPDRAQRAVAEWGFDAASSYGWAPPGTLPYAEYPFDSSRTAMSWYRNELAARNVAAIPPVVTGWDSRPLEPFGRPPYSWYTRATPSEIATQLKEAIAWVKANPTRAPANSVLFYAWNEFAEGGWLAPTLQHGSARVDAIAAARGLAIPAEVPKLAPVPTPSIQQILPEWSCPGGYGVWLEGANLDPDVYIETRPASIIGDDEFFHRYETPTWIWTDQLVQCFATAEEQAAFDTDGVRITLINPQRPSASTPYLLTRF